MKLAADPVEAPAPKPRFDHIDGIRAAAALVVYFNHAYAQTWNAWLGSYPSGWFATTAYSLVAGHLAVTVFIVVSGFCLALPVIDHGRLRGGIVNFLKRRARRILPPYYAALALCLGLIFTVLGMPTGTLWDVPLQVTVTPFRSILAHLLLVQDLFATSHINYVFWSIAVEWHIYFLMPLLVWAWSKYGAGVVVLGSLAGGYALTLGFLDGRIARAHPHYVGMFALGMFAAYVARSGAATYQRLRQRVPWRVIALLSFALAVGLTAFWGVNASTGRFHLLDMPVGIMAMAVLVVTSAPGESRLRRVFGWRPLVFVGTFSYSLYLVHAPLLQLLWYYVVNPLGMDPRALFVTLMTLGLAVVLLAAYGFHLLFEAPFMKSPNAPRRSEPAAIPTG